MNQSEFIIGDNLELESFFKHSINTLKDTNIPLKKQAAMNIHLKIKEHPNLSQQILNKIGKDLLKLFSDPIEKCREYSIRSINELLQQSDDHETILPYLITTLVERSNCTDLEGISHLPEVMRPPPSQLPQMLIKFVETSEEVRLQLVELLYTMVSKNDSDNLHEFVDDIVDIHRAFLMDPFGDIQKAACKSLSKFCQVNHQMLLHFTEKMARAVLFPLISKKSPIRIAALETLNSVLLCGVWKNNAFVFEVLTGFRDPNSVPIKAFYQPMHNINYLATLIIDPKPQVRDAFIKSIGFWLTKLADRWDHHPRLVPYLLSGLFDSDNKIQENALSIIEDVGKEWEVEREKDIIDYKQLGIEPKWTLNGKLNDLPLPQPFKSRPSIGCRGFIKNQVRKMWPALYKEILDSSEDSRLKASSLILMGVIFSEEYMTQFLDAFVTNTIIGIRIGQSKYEEQILKNLKETYRFIGRYCEYQSYEFIIFNLIKGKYISDEIFIQSATIALEALVYGALEATIDGIGEKYTLLVDITNLLISQINYMTNKNYQQIESLINTILNMLEQKGNQNEIDKFKNENSQQLHLILNTVSYIHNFNHILLGSKLSDLKSINLNQISKNKLPKQDLNLNLDISYGDPQWQNLIIEFVYNYDNESNSYTITELISNQLSLQALPETIDFISKLILTLEITNPLHIQNVIMLNSYCCKWISNQNNSNMKLMELLLINQLQIAKVLSKKREIAKALIKDQKTLSHFTLMMLTTIESYYKIYKKKQYQELVNIVCLYCELFLPYPNSKLLKYDSQFLIPKLIKFIFDCIGVLGDNPKHEIRKQLFQMLSYINQFIPIVDDQYYQGDEHIHPKFQEYLTQLLRYAIEEKDLPSQDLYKIVLFELCKKTRYNFQIEFDQSRKRNLLSRIELLNSILQ